MTAPVHLSMGSPRVIVRVLYARLAGHGGSFVLQNRYPNTSTSLAAKPSK